MIGLTDKAAEKILERAKPEGEIKNANKIIGIPKPKKKK